MGDRFQKFDFAGSTSRLLLPSFSDGKSIEKKPLGPTLICRIDLCIKPAICGIGSLHSQMIIGAKSKEDAAAAWGYSENGESRLLKPAPIMFAQIPAF
jgi:hypothetical protein